MQRELEARLRANPQDETLWLVYGDWLLEQGGPLAEVVRLERRLARSRPGRARPLLERERRALYEAHRQAWQGWDVAPEFGLTWRHGLIVAADISMTEELGVAIESLIHCRGARLLNAVRMQLPPYATQAGHLEWYLEDLPRAPLRSLALAHGATLEQLQIVVRYEPLRCITELDLTELQLREPFAETLAQGLALGNLKTLRLDGNALGDEGACVLARSEVLRSLTRLDLRAAGLGDEGALALARSETLAALTTLDVRDNHIGPAGMHALEARDLQTLYSSDRRR